MRIRFLLFIISICLFSLSACKKVDSLNIGDQQGLADIKVPEGFTWESSRDINFKVTITDTRYQNAIYVIAIYSVEGQLLSKGSASLNQPFESKIYVPGIIKEAYIIKTAPDNSTTSLKVKLESTDIKVSMGASIEGLSSAKSTTSTLSISPDCNSGCTQSITLNSNNQSVSIADGKTVCVSGSNKAFNVSFGKGGGTLRICGTNLTLQDISNNSINDASSIIITSSSIVVFDDKNKKATNFNQNNNTLENYGTLTFNGGINLAGVLKNYGSITVNGEYSTETQTNPVTEHTNNGSIVVNGLMDIGSNSVFYNNGSIKTTDFRVFNHSTFYNYCKLWVTNEYDHSTLMKNYGYIKVDEELFINGSSELALYNGAMLSTKNVKINGTIKGYNTTSFVKIGNETELTGAGLITGAIKYCDGNGIEKQNGTIASSVSLACDMYIPVSGCNPEGNGSQPVKDSDGDGVSDQLDDYPDDINKAFNNYYPSGNADAGATIAFEDMWPARGDYDMNDVVVSYQLKVVTNFANKVVEVNGNYSLYARGGIFQNGFGIEFPIDRSLVSDVQGAELEEGQQKAVLILFSNMQNEMFYMNTRPEDPISPAKAYSIRFTVKNGPSLSSFGLGEYNPFVWNKGLGRGYEIHLPGKFPTTLANPKLFGTSQDASDPSKGKYYVTADGFPWAISIPVKNFAYPLEGKDISTAYLKLAAWVSSGGTNYQDWYLNTSSQYRNTSNIFTK